MSLTFEWISLIFDVYLKVELLIIQYYEFINVPSIGSIIPFAWISTDNGEQDNQTSLNPAADLCYDLWLLLHFRLTQKLHEMINAFVYFLYAVGFGN